LDDSGSQTGGQGGVDLVKAGADKGWKGAGGRGQGAQQGSDGVRKEENSRRRGGKSARERREWRGRARCRALGAVHLCPAVLLGYKIRIEDEEDRVSVE